MLYAKLPITLINRIRGIIVVSCLLFLTIVLSRIEKPNMINAYIPSDAKTSSEPATMDEAIQPTIKIGIIAVIIEMSFIPNFAFFERGVYNPFSLSS